MHAVMQLCGFMQLCDAVVMQQYSYMYVMQAH